MKAWQLIKNGPPEKAFVLKESDISSPGAGELLIESQGFGLNFADVLARLGLYRDCPPLPTVIGYENVGHIKAIGPEVSGFSVGDRVLAFTRFGGYADTLVVSQIAAAKTPDSWDVGTATALATQYITAQFAVEETVNLYAGDHVLIHAAAGGVGTALVQMLKNKGCIVFGTAGSDEKLDYLSELGVDYPINYRKTDYQNEIEKLGFGRKLDATFNPIGGDYVKKDWKLLNAGGRAVLFGASKLTAAKGNPFKMLGLLFGFGFWNPVKFIASSRSMIGINMLRIGDHKPALFQRSLKRVIELAEQGKIKPVVGKIFKAAELPEAHKYLEERQSIGKVAVEW